MSKNTDFFILGPYSRKNSIRTGTMTKIGQLESNRAKTAISRADSALATRVEVRQSWDTRAPATRGSSWADAGRLVRFGSARLAFAVWLGLFFFLFCKRQVSSPRWSCVAPADGRHVSSACHAAHCRSPADCFFFPVFCNP